MSDIAHFDKVQVDGQKEMQIILTTLCKCSSFLKGYHTYQNIWDSVKGEIIQAKMEPMNSVDMQPQHALEHFKKRTNNKFASTIFYFLKCDRITDAGLKLLQSDAI